MNDFFAALGHLLLQSLHSTVGWMGTTLLALAIGALNHYVVPYIDGVLDGEKPAKKPLLKRIRGTVIVTLATWLLLYCLNVGYTIYTDHANLAAQNQSKDQRIRDQEQQLEQNTSTIGDLNRKLSTLTIQEPNDSLRRRTFKLADDLTDYLMMRQGNHPPYAYPDSRDPNPSEERKKMILTAQSFDQETMNYYSKHFKDRLVGILKEYNARGVKTGYLESDANQRLPAIAPPGSITEGSCYDDLSQFRDLAYHVDAKGNLITF
jgi:hypothetical protein